MYGTAPPKIDARNLRPRRTWYIVAVAIFLVCSTLGGFVFVWALQRIFDIGEGLQELYGGRAVVRLTPEGHQTLYASRELTTAEADRQCTVSGPAKARITDVEGSRKVTADSEWIAAAELQVPKAGKYTVKCSSDDHTTYAVGPNVAELSGRTGKAVGGTFGFFALVGGGFVAALTIIIVTLIRRNGHRKRLLAEAGWLPGRGQTR